jgi:hypothetical protein
MHGGVDISKYEIDRYWQAETLEEKIAIGSP